MFLLLRSSAFGGALNSRAWIALDHPAPGGGDWDHAPLAWDAQI